MGPGGRLVTRQHGEPGTGWPRLTGSLSARRRWAGLAVALVGLPLLTVAILAVRHDLALSSVLLLYLGGVVAVALVGGGYPAVLAALLGSLLANFFFTPPLHTFDIAGRDNLLALVMFLLVGLAVASVVDLAARRSRQASRSQAEAEMLSALSRTVLAGERALPALLGQVRDAFGQRLVTLLEWRDGDWATVAKVGTTTPGDRAPGDRAPDNRAPDNRAPDNRAPDNRPPADADADIPVTDTLRLVLSGRPLPASDRRVLTAFAAQAAVALRQERLTRRAAEAAELAEGNRMRTALLAAVSHDLRTPLASIKAAATALRLPAVALGPDDLAELHATIDESADQLAGLVDNLLDMSRLQTGAVNPLRRLVSLDEVVPRALGPRADLTVDVPETLPPVLADPGLLERAIANLVGNAVRHGGCGPVAVRASVRGDRVELRVVDHGPGVAPGDRERIFAPFQRLGDRPVGNGVGLGLAVARGFIEANDGTLVPEDTPGGGLTMVVSLPTP